MGKELNLLAFDCGNSTVRTILCRYDGEKIVSETLLSDSNDMIRIGELFYWDALHIFSLIKKGLEAASRKVEKIDSVGVCTWGIDFMMFDKNGMMLSNMLCYRNTIGASQLEKLTPEEKREMFDKTGILCHQMNTVYMLGGLREMMPDTVANMDKILLVPDTLTYFLTGKMINEPSELSTSQMFDVKEKKISADICEKFGVDKSIFNEIGEHGKPIGNIRRDILDELNIEYDIPVICVPSHDTACAVLGIPAEDEEHLFVSSGTWALIGACIKEPVIDDLVYEGTLANEMGGFGRITLLKNSIGMFITQRLKAEYERDIKGSVNWDDFTALSRLYKGEAKIFDVNHDDFYNPTHMAKAIQSHINPGAGDKYDWPEILASTYESLAESYAVGVRAVMQATKRDYDVLYVVGGGAKNGIINQKCADKLNMRLACCAAECSSVGNAVTQLKYFYPEKDYSDLKKIVRNSLKVKDYMPQNRG